MSAEKFIQPVRGTHDLFGPEYERHAFIIEKAYKLARRYGFEPLHTPIIEKTQVFKKTIGQDTDIVGKEMYTFLDRGEEEITLRPEGTASVVRALISNNLTQSLPAKFIYSGPMFRYERPQKGRQRQFHHIGVEYFGSTSSYIDVETIDLAASLLKQLGIYDKVTLTINTLGTAPTRKKYREALVKYLSNQKNDLSEDSQRRLETNPLRILDSKSEMDQDIIKKAPVLMDFLPTEEQTFFEEVCQGLNNLEISYQINPKLVRGLDYYNHTVFEFITAHLGAQSTVLGGGRYDGLVSQMGGPDISAIGWALGLERIAMLLDYTPSTPRPIVILPLDEESKNPCMKLAKNLRVYPWHVEVLMEGNLNKRMRIANKYNAKIALIMGSDERVNDQVMLKDLDTGLQDHQRLSEVSIAIESILNQSDKIS